MKTILQRSGEPAAATPVEKRHPAGDRPTLAQFRFDGRAALDAAVAARWGTPAQALASLTVFAHPDVVRAIGFQPLFRMRRRRTGDPPKTADDRWPTTTDGFVLDDNRAPETAFCAATGFRRGRDLQCNHLYPAARSLPEFYTDLRNIVFTPAFLAKLTDSQARTLGADHHLQLLRWHARTLYGPFGPAADAPHHAPEGYEALVWAEPIGAARTAAVIQRAVTDLLKRRPMDRVTRSVRHLGWAFSGSLPDMAVRCGCGNCPAV